MKVQATQTDEDIEIEDNDDYDTTGYSILGGIYSRTVQNLCKKF